MPNTPTKPQMPMPMSTMQAVLLWRDRSDGPSNAKIASYARVICEDRDAQWLAYAEALAAQRVREEREACAVTVETARLDAFCTESHMRQRERNRLDMAAAIRARKD